MNYVKWSATTLLLLVTYVTWFSDGLAQTRTSDACNVSWSDVSRDGEAGQHYVDFTNGCDESYYCYVVVYRGGRRNVYGWCVGPHRTKRIYIGRLGRDDKAYPNADLDKPC